ncbi:DUF1289 domain-containing protein [Janthinobacterium sp. BJB412]|jgi:predicted Fe-S protein YdhL (DUF1289 family)|nr:DUF1289 domain-containing protein [Janthinobacterium sp. BJB412]
MSTELKSAPAAAPSTAPSAAPPAPVPSPCVSLCKMDPDSGFCVGCLRTIDEIVQWAQAGDDFKRAVWAEIKRREELIDFD